MFRVLQGGLGADPQDPVEGFLALHPSPSSTDVVSFLQTFDPGQRGQIAQQLLARGVSTQAVSSAMTWFDWSSRWERNKATVLGTLALAAAGAAGYHGYRRNKSMWWAGVWFGAGLIFPLFTSIVSVAQGWAKPKAA